MILIDTSIWIDHFRQDDATVESLLDRGQVLMHPFVVGELAVGNLQPRETVLKELKELPNAVVATDDDVLFLIHHHKLFGLGIGYIDCHLLASVQMAPGTSLLTRDKRLKQAAVYIGLATNPEAYVN